MASPGKYDVSASYLYLVSSDATVDRVVNAAVASDLNRRRDAFTKEAEEAIAASRNDPRPLTPQQVALDITCNEAWATETTFSIECQRYANLGGAYPNVDYFAYDFGICAGRAPAPITLDAVCRPEAPCRRTIVDRINERLAIRGIDERIGLDADALKDFAVTDGGLRFYANDDLPHAVAAAGIVDVPFRQLRSVLRPGGPLGPLLAP